MNKSTRKFQIGVMGSMADLKYSKTTEQMAEEVGYWIAKSGATLVFGAEKDADSLSTAACRGAKKAGGLTVGVTYGKGLEVFEKNVDVVIASGMERGGGRELTLALSCDAIITLNGGSGTLTEIAIAYQANIPVIAVSNTGGWSAKLAGEFLDSRKRVMVGAAKNPKTAVEKALSLAAAVRNRKPELLVLTSVHGNEQIGTKAIRQLELRETVNFDWLIANEKAFKKNKRFVNIDLNRSAPGKRSAKEYEIKRAYDLIQTARDYRYVIDIHGTDAKTGIFAIVANPKLENLLLAGSLPITNIVLWSSRQRTQAGPVTQFVDCGIEIECGPQNSPLIRKQLMTVLRTLSQQPLIIDAKNIANKKFFKVYGKITKDSISKNLSRTLRDFEETSIEGETFFPLLCGCYDSVICYKMRLVNFPTEFSY